MVSPQQWSINTTDYQSTAYAARSVTSTILKERLVEEWRRFDHNVIDRALEHYQWRSRLRKCDFVKRVIYVVRILRQYY